MPLDVIKTFSSLPTFDASCYRVHPPAKFFFDRSEIFFVEIDSIGSFTKIFFITRCGRLLVRSLFNRSWLRKFFFSESILSAAHRLQHRIVLALRVDAPGCQVYSGPQNRQAYHDQVIQPGLTPFKIIFYWYRSLKGSGQNFYRHLVFVFHFHHSFQNLS